MLFAFSNLVSVSAAVLAAGLSLGVMVVALESMLAALEARFVAIFAFAPRVLPLSLPSTSSIRFYGLFGLFF
jgi:hypothetical protein